MCLVIDTGCIPKVFDPTNREHGRFIPVWEWINSGRGYMIYGGTKYLTELNRLSRYLRLIAELNRKGRLVIISKTQVDQVSVEIKQKINKSDLDDEHLMVIVIVSRCMVVCTDDLMAIPYLKMTDIYAGYHVKRPKIYCKLQHGSLCCDRNVRIPHGP